MSLSEIYSERYNPASHTGELLVVDRQPTVTAVVRYQGHFGVGKASTREQAIENAWIDSGKPNGAIENE
jgi:hypothetical protein